MISRNLRTLCVSDPDKRREAVEEILRKEQIPFTIQEDAPSEKFPRGIRNYLFHTGGKINAAPDCAGTRTKYLFTAHYDAYPGSTGANDNAAAACILIDLYQELLERHIPAWFAFFDGEENGHLGSKLYCDCMEPEDPKAAVNLDLCGFGDTIVLNAAGAELSKAFYPFCCRESLRSSGAQKVKFLPESDDVILRKGHLPTLSVSVVPRWDLQYLKSLSAMGEGLLGRSPEFKMIISSMEVCSTMHGGYRDNEEAVNPDNMRKVLDFLIRVVTGPVPARNLRDFL
ncbi:MAG: M28 family peptidase [Firmicutes bacterium]|nr:M28 family peptidase [Bacillota bacterium]